MQQMHSTPLMFLENPSGIFDALRHRVVKVCVTVVFLLPTLLVIPNGSVWIWCITFTLSNLLPLYGFYEKLRGVEGRCGTLRDRIKGSWPMIFVLVLKLIAITCSWVVATMLGELDVCIALPSFVHEQELTADRLCP